MDTPRVLISGSYNAFEEGWNGCGVYTCSGLYESETYKLPVYVGSAKDLQDRIECEHIAYLNRNRHPHNKPFQNAWNKHSEREGFVWFLLESCNAESRLDVEQAYLDSYRPFVDEFGGFNINHFAKGSPMEGRNHTPETRLKMRNSHLGEIHSEEHKRKTRESCKGINKGRKLSESHKRKLGEAKAKVFKLRSPTGKISEGFNVRSFCRENNLCAAVIGRVLKGKSPHHKGWRRVEEGES